MLIATLIGLLAVEPGSSSSGSDVSGWVSMGAIAAACGAFWKWLAPRLDKLFDVVPQLQTLCERNTCSLESLTATNKEQASSFNMLARLVSASHAAQLQARNVVLLIEDSLVDARLVRGLVADIIAEYHLVMIDVSNLEEAYQHVPYACVIVLDVQLPDSNVEAIQSFARVCPCPVVIHTGTDHDPTVFEAAFAVCRKGATSPDELHKTIERAVIAARRR